MRVTLALTTIHQLIINGAPYHRAPGFLCSEVRGDERSTCASNDTGNDEKCHEKSTNAVTSSKLTNNFMASSLCLKLSLRIFFFSFSLKPFEPQRNPQGNSSTKQAIFPREQSAESCFVTKCHKFSRSFTAKKCPLMFFFHRTSDVNDKIH